jgi:6,7-dimethyl-8-ribityllumazine synthase
VLTGQKLMRRLIAGGQTQSAKSAPSMLASTTNLLSLIDTSSADQTKATTPAVSSAKSAASTGAFDAVIAIGCLLKGSTMHFEYICDAVSQGLMRVQLDTGTPVIFGVLTCLTEDQALERAGVGRGDKGKGHSEFPSRPRLNLFDKY